MTVKKHNLTKNDDTIGGTAGTDLYLAPLVDDVATLTGADALNGAGGTDTIKATLQGASFAPSLKNIERGLFGWKENASFTLDLAKAKSMQTLVLNAIDNDFDVTNGVALRSISLRDSHSWMTIGGIDPGPVGHLSFSFSDTSATTFKISTLNDEPLKSVDVTLNNSSVNFAVNAPVSAVAIHSMGEFTNDLTFTHDSGFDHIRKISIYGDANSSVKRIGGFAELRVIDATRAKASVSAALDSPELVRFRGGMSGDAVALIELGGQAGAPAQVELGKGADIVGTAGLALDGALVHIDGGAGVDLLRAQGVVANTTGMLSNVERLVLESASGTWHLDGSGVDQVDFESAAASTTVLSGIESGSTVVFTAPGGFRHQAGGGAKAAAASFSAQTASISVLVEGAALSKREGLVVELNDGVQIGDTTHGLSAAGLSHLEISSLGGENKIYLGTIGGLHDGADVTITGDERLQLASITSAAGHIDFLRIKNAAGVDMSGLASAGQAFDPNGVTIIGGAGDDDLVGGGGDDVIRTGGGDNTVRLGAGFDHIWLKANSGLDVIYLDSYLASPVGGPQVVHNFAVTDTIDISALVNAVSFKGNFETFEQGSAALTTNVAGAFFETSGHTLYVDVNHDAQIDAFHDVGIQLANLDAIQSWNLVA